jgi:hypothetical protein
MIKYAELDSENKVINIILGTDVFVSSLPGIFIKETDENGEAVIGATYDKDLNKFIRQQPYASWTLNSAGEWVAPAEKPNDGKKYTWMEDSLEWEEIVQIELPLEPVPPQI